ncbi:MAG: hypothetical protein COA94_08435 [Rickettsiales bacterium]|nr:MAG: hypothetical protein COA94_08435 [Rickettsiales bacterium]
MKRVSLESRRIQGDNEEIFKQALEQQDVEAVRSLISKGNFNVNGSIFYQPLIEAIKLDLVEVVGLLLGAKANPNQPSRHGNTILEEAVARGNHAMLSVLLEHGADPKQSSIFNSPLRQAIEDGNHKAAKLLLDKGCDPNQGRAFHDKPLFIAQEVGDEDMIALLQKHGANLEISMNPPALVDTETYERDDGAPSLTSFPGGGVFAGGGIFAGGSITITARSFENTGTMSAGDEIKLNVESFNDTGLINGQKVTLNLQPRNDLAAAESAEGSANLAGDSNGDDEVL